MVKQVDTADLKSAAFPKGGVPVRSRLRAPSQGLVRLRSNTMDLNQAIAAHAQWKQRFRSAITSRATLDTAEIRQHDRCALGCWLHGAGSAEHGARPQFVHLIEQHRRFHAEAARVAQAINAGQYDQALEMIEGPTAYGQATVAIGQAVQALRQALETR